MAHRFKNADGHTPLLLPPDLGDWVAEDDLVCFVNQAVERLPLCTFAVNHMGCGDEQYPPHMMLGRLIYCYANGIFSSRQTSPMLRPACARATAFCLNSAS